MNAADAFRNPAIEPGFLFKFQALPSAGLFLFFGPTPVSLPKADASDVEVDLFEDSR